MYLFAAVTVSGAGSPIRHLGEIEEGRSPGDRLDRGAELTAPGRLSAGPGA